MLIQSHSGVVRLFPAIPADWDNVSFSQLRTEGGFLISSKLTNGELEYTEVQATVDGELKIAFGALGKPISRNLKKGEVVLLTGL